MSNEIAIINARQRSRIRDVNDNDVLAAITAIVGKTFLTAGQSTTKEDVVFMASELVRDLKNRFQALTVDEVAIALNNGVKCDYGKYFGLNVVTFNNWLTAYKNSPERAKAIEDQLKSKAIAPPVRLTPEQREGQKTALLIVGLRLYEKRGTLPGSPDEIYNILKERNLIGLSKQEMWDIYNEVKDNLMKESASQKKEHKGVKTIGEGITEYLTPTQLEARAKFLSRKIVVDRFYQNVIDKNLNIKEMPYGNLTASK